MKARQPEGRLARNGRLVLVSRRNNDTTLAGGIAPRGQRALDDGPAEAELVEALAHELEKLGAVAERAVQRAPACRRCEGPSQWADGSVCEPRGDGAEGAAAPRCPRASGPDPLMYQARVPTASAPRDRSGGARPGHRPEGEVAVIIRRCAGGCAVAGTGPAIQPGECWSTSQPAAT